MLKWENYREQILLQYRTATAAAGLAIILRISTPPIFVRVNRSLAGGEGIVESSSSITGEVSRFQCENDN